MKKSDKRKSGRKRKQIIHMCCDRILTGSAKIKAMEAAIVENGVNQPPAPARSRRRFGASSMGAPLKMALEAGKKWRDGRTLGVFFMDGSTEARTWWVSAAPACPPMLRCSGEGQSLELAHCGPATRADECLL